MVTSVFDIVAILGRGSQRLKETDPVKETSSYAPTENLELCDKDSAHLHVRAPMDDESPFCMIGGGWMNLLAGAYLIKQYHPKIVVCAHGDRSAYLKSIDGPSESEVMHYHLQQILSCLPMQDPNPEFLVWPRTRTAPGNANTRQELLNIFDLALERGLPRIALVTVGVHVPRTATYIAKHLSVYEQYRALSPVLFESEEILLHADRERHNAEVEVMRKSESFARNWQREADGIQKIIRDVYGDAKPKVVTA